MHMEDIYIIMTGDIVGISLLSIFIKAKLLYLGIFLLQLYLNSGDIIFHIGSKTSLNFNFAEAVH